MQGLLKKISIGYATCLLIACGSGPKHKATDSSLVRVAIVKLVNVSGAPLYEYLSDSLTDATRASMQRKFRYFDLPAEETQRLFVRLNEQGGSMTPEELRTQALRIDADLVIYGKYTTSSAKKGDSAEITFSVFRTDKGMEIWQGNRQTKISGAIFKEIDLIAAQVVSEIAAYRKQQLAEQGETEMKETTGEKIELTRDSINIHPFIPPVF